MATEERNQEPHISFANVVSGAYTTKLIDTLYGVEPSAERMEELHQVFRALADQCKFEEAMKLIRSLYLFANLEYPYQIAIMENNMKTQEIYVLEFVADFYEMMDEQMMLEELEKESKA